MTPKEKAKELIDKMYPQMYCYMGSGMLSNSYDAEVAMDNAKKCALICVQEILSIKMVNHIGNHNNTPSNEGQYWEAVKEEIQKL